MNSCNPPENPRTLDFPIGQFLFYALMSIFIVMISTHHGLAQSPGLLKKNYKQTSRSIAEFATALGSCANLDVFNQVISTGNGAPSQDFEPSYSFFDVEAADDFTLPVATSLVSVSVVGTAPTAAPDSFRVTIFRDEGGKPGVIMYSEIFVDPAFNATPTFDLSSCPVLNAGTYWLSVQAIASFGTYGQWFWTTASDGVGQPWMVQNPAGGFVGGCTTWSNGMDCDFAGASGPGLMFSLSSCLADVLSDVGPNCRNVNVSLDENGNTFFNLADVVTNFPAAAPAKVTVTRSFGTVVFGPATVYTGNIIFNACHLLNETLTVTVETNGGTCWSNLTFKQLNGPVIESRNQTVYCIDEVTRKPDLSQPPKAFIPCQSPFNATFVTDWQIPYECLPGQQDTVKVILREWEAYDKIGRRGFSFDTIVVLLFGEIDSNHIYCVDRDTLYCSDTTQNIGPFITFENTDLTCDTLWLVRTSDVDNDGVLEFHPAIFDSKCGLDVHVSDHKFKADCGNLYKVMVDIKQSCYGPAQENCLVTPPVGVSPNMAQQLAPGYWRCEFWLYDLDTLGPEIYCKGADLFNGPFAIKNWHIIANPNNEIPSGYFFDPENTIDLGAIPYQIKINSHHEPEPIISGTINEDQLTLNNGLGPYYQDARLSFTAAEHLTFNFGWTFDLDPFPMNQSEETARVLQNDLYATLSYYISVNGVEYPVIQEGDIEESTKRNTTNPVLLTSSRDGILSIPLAPGDQFSIFASWISPSRATLTLYGQNIVSTSEHECSAHTYIPALYAKDDWRGVKQVKAIVETAGSFILSYDEADDCWVSHERVKLPKNGEYYKVVYEAYDSCHNFSSDSCFIYVKDRIKPVPVMKKGLTISLSDKKIWMDYKAFDEGSYDNCAVNLVLIRRSDWQESCINLCDEVEPCYVGPHHDTLWLSHLETDKTLDEVEAHYSRTLDWLCQDDTPCGQLIYNAWVYDLMKYATLHCNDHLYGVNETYFKEKFSEAYYSSADFRSKFRECQPEDPEQSTADRFSPFHPDLGNLVDLYDQLGGGWSEAVAFDCSDACSAVTVEMLVMDYWCNWTRIWNQVRVEDKTSAMVVQDVKDFETISCKSFRDKKYSHPGQLHPVSVEYIVAQAKAGNEESFIALDQIFGGFQKAWKGEYGGYVDLNGDKIDTDILFVDSICLCNDAVEQVYVYDEHLGYYWKDSLITNCYYHPDTIGFQHGIVLVNCQQNVYCEQEVWTEIDHCGQGFLHRKFKIWKSCPDSFYFDPPLYDSLRHPVDTLVRHQRIYIGNECPLNKFMFEVPGDMSIKACGVYYDDQGNVTGDAGPENTGYATYKFDDDCRIVGIGHKDKVFKVVGGEEACFKIFRTWYFADWCGTGGKPVKKNWWEDYSLVLDSCVQKILVIDETPPICTLIGPVMEEDTIEMGGCSYDLRVRVRAEDLCGLTRISWELKNLTDPGAGLQDYNQGELSGHEQDFEIVSTGLLPGHYKLEVHLRDECNNDSYCDYSFWIKSVKKPTAICFTSLTARLTPWDRDQDGKVDTALAVIWASEFDRSSSPTCGDDSLEFRLEILTNTPDDLSPAGDADYLELGCDHIGSRLVRLWVISHPSGTVDYCDVVLIVQSDFTGCTPDDNDQSTSLDREMEVTGLSPHVYRSSVDESGENIQLASKVNARGLDSGAIYELDQNNPNPFRSETTIGFTLPQSMEAVITLYDLSGKLIKKYSGYYPMGYSQLTIQKNDLPPSAIILYRLEAGDYSGIKRMILIE